MKKIFGQLLNIIKQQKKKIRITVKHGSHQTILQCENGENLMDVTNKIVNEDVNIYGLCDKQLACTTCSVYIQSHFDKLQQPTQEQLDVIMTVPKCTENTRMACQIKLNQQLDNLIIRIPQKNSKLN